MRFGSVVLAAVLALCAPAQSAAQNSPSPWARLASDDLKVIHQLIADNHPGPADRLNPGFLDWLEKGFAQVGREAAAARSFADYRRALRRYVNGFRDIHVALDLVPPMGPGVWPGFIVTAADDAGAKVAFSADEAVIPKGSSLLGCDGKSLPDLLRQHVDPYFYNNDIPHWRREFYNRLFYLPEVDTRRLQTCRFRTTAGVVVRPLQWRVIDGAEFGPIFQKANEVPDLPPMGMRQVDGVWYIRIPTFGGYNAEQRQGLADLEAEIARNAAALRIAPKIVFDVRFNDGGDSSIGNAIASALWSRELVDAVRNSASVREYTEFRASPKNRARMASYLDKPGMTEEALDYTRRALKAIDAAMAKGQALARLEESAASAAATTKMSPNPVKGRVYVLTSGCGSACLDFLDVLLNILGVTQIGLPTLADAVYMESSGMQGLPSGLAEIAYPMKVIRNRARRHNQWYEPKIRWPGGAMTEKAVADWIKTLP